MVPSLREQFGIVAVEAMMCGCPVIASRVGGLRDIVLDGRTGALFDPGNCGSLVAAILAYLRSPALRDWHSENARRWADERFSISRICTTFESLFAGENMAEDRPLETSQGIFRTSELGRYVVLLQEALRDTATGFRDLTSSPALSARVSLKKAGDVFLKVYPQRPSYFSCLFPAVEDHGSQQSRDISLERLTLLEFLRGQDYLPTILLSDLENRYVAQSWHQSRAFRDFRDMFRAAKATAKRLGQATATTAPEAGLRAEFMGELRRLGRHSVAAEIDGTTDLDQIGARLGRDLLGHRLRVRRIHPQIELLRLRDFLSRNSYWLPITYKMRAAAEIDFLLSLKPLIVREPVFAHGTLKEEHFLSASKLCDFDHAGYYCGPVDLAHCIWECFKSGREPNSRQMLLWLGRLVNDSEELFLGVCWILMFTLNRDLISLAQGRWPLDKGPSRFLLRWQEAVRRSLSLS